MRVDRRRFLALAAGGLSGFRMPRLSASERVSLAARLHEDTRNTLAGTIGRKLRPSAPPLARAKGYPHRARDPLPSPGGFEGAALDAVAGAFAPAGGFEPTPLSRQELGRLLYLSNGVTRPGRLPLRAAPSAGALYAGEVYVVAQRVADLAPGIYAYQVPTHSLVPLSEGVGMEDLSLALERPDAFATAAAWVVLSNVFRRYGQRYANRAYRYALIDSGHIGENLRLAAAAEGWGVTSALRFCDERLNALVGVDGREEAVCAAHALGRPVHGDVGAPGRSWMEAQRSSDFRSDTSWSTPELFHASTCLIPGDLASPGARPAQGAIPETASLPKRAAPERSVSWTIRNRRSTRRFSDTAVSLPDLAYLLSLAQGNAAARLAPGVELRVVAHRITGLSSGLYQYRAVAHRLDPIRAGDLRGVLRRVCLGQDKAATAAAGVAMVADLGMSATAGDRLYRDQLLEAGAIAQRLYLGAEALGLSARNLAAFFDDSLNALLAVDGRQQAVIHLTMLGAGD